MDKRRRNRIALLASMGLLLFVGISNWAPLPKRWMKAGTQVSAQLEQNKAQQNESTQALMNRGLVLVNILLQKAADR